MVGTQEDVAVVGSGPNALAAAAIMGRAGLRVAVYEAQERLGGGARSEHIFDSSVLHDVCSAVHPMAAAAPFFREFDLHARGVELSYPEISYAHPIDGQRSGIAYRDLHRTSWRLGIDGDAWHNLMAPLVRHSRAVVDLMLSDLRRLPADGLRALALLAPRVGRHGTALAGSAFTDAQAPAMLAGLGGHINGALPSLPAGAIALLLGHLAHAGGWPVVRGGSQRVIDALLSDIRAYGGTTHAATPITDIRELAHARAILLDTAPFGFLDIARPVLPAAYRARLAGFKHGPGAAKVDFLLSEPIPWSDPELAHAGTLHLAGDQAATFARETKASRGIRPAEPFVLLAQQSVVDPQRAARDAVPVWAYCHVPHGDERDPVEMVSGVIERYAPGFSDTVLASKGDAAAQMAESNANYVGGDIAAGAVTPWQSVFRPVARLNPYSTPLTGVYLCSASTPPGPGVHGMCGYFAARAALRREFGVTSMPSLAP